ncbi:MAG: DNA methyltransferase [Pseudomonas sp.]|uniref:DNA methyltransferase n=1 Tax=Pseudomonas sp. TaxID=306 RepID=UPI003D6E4DA0
MTTKNPKLKSKKTKSLYKYYAGFSEEFVESAISRSLLQFELNTSLLVLDPWNGSGTTTHFCSKVGTSSIGLDRNPLYAASGGAG